MDAVRAFAVAVCAGALVCALLWHIVPSKGSGRVYRLLLAGFFLCCFLSPLTRLSGIEWPALPASLSITGSGALEQRVTEQLAAQVRSRAAEVARLALEAQNIQPDKIDVSVDTGPDGSIYIAQIDLYLSGRQQRAASVARQVLMQQLQAQVLVHTADGRE